MKAMFYKNDTNWDLLAKFLAGEANPEEVTALEEWRNANPSNNELLQKLKSDWKKMERMNARFDVDKAWNNINDRISAEAPAHVTETVTIAPVTVKRLLTPMRIAATLLLLTLLGVALYTVINRVSTVQVIAAVNEKGKTVALPDGSLVTLNADTKLHYSKKFGKINREITLTGEAFFDVKHDASKPFVIHAGDARVRVLGTSFNVNMREKNEGVEVYVTTGLVELSENNNVDNRQLIQPGNIGILHNNKITVAHTGDANSLAWKTGKITFSDTPLGKAVSVLGKFYNVHIVLKGEGMDTININGSYKQNDPLDLILEVIGSHNPQLSIAKSGDTVYLSQD
jgi:transmembrane sensor